MSMLLLAGVVPALMEFPWRKRRPAYSRRTKAMAACTCHADMAFLLQDLSWNLAAGHMDPTVNACIPHRIAWEVV